MLEPIPSLDALDAAVEAAKREGSVQAQVHYLANRYLSDESLRPRHPDPFSPVYRDEVAAIHARISKRPDCLPEREEFSAIDPGERVFQPSIHLDGGSKHLGMYVEAVGQILQAADLRPGAKVVEFGPGDGQLIIPFARMGCDVAIVDIDQRHLDTVSRQLNAIGHSAHECLCRFDEDTGLRDYDLALFFEEFQHAIDHEKLLINLYEILNDNGRIIFAGEPIVDSGTSWDSIMPGPWGLRLDGLSVSQIRRHGWMKLGFRESYFIELLMRCGWAVEKRVSASGRDTAYIARKIGGEIRLGDPICLDVHDRAHGWHGVEPTGRWTGPDAVITLPTFPAALWDASVVFYNQLGITKDVVVLTDFGDYRTTLPPHQRGSIMIPKVGGRLTIWTPDPLDLSTVTGGADTRVVGSFVERISLKPAFASS